jgi:hypothetical protein
VGKNKETEWIWIWLDQANETQEDAGTTPGAMQEEKHEAGLLWLKEARGLDRLMPCLISSEEERETDDEADSLLSCFTDLEEDVGLLVWLLGLLSRPAKKTLTFKLFSKNYHLCAELATRVLVRCFIFTQIS